MFTQDAWQINNIMRITDTQGRLVWNRCVEQNMNPFIGSRDTNLREIEAMGAMEQGKWTKPAITLSARTPDSMTENNGVYTWNGSYYFLINFNQEIPVGATVNLAYETLEGSEATLTYCTWQFADGTEGKTAFNMQVTSAVVPDKPVKAVYCYKTNPKKKTTQSFRITECKFTTESPTSSNPVNIYGNNGVVGLSKNLFNMNAPITDLELLNSETGNINSCVGIKITDKAGDYYATAINPNKRDVYYYLAIYDPITKAYTAPPNIIYFILQRRATSGSFTLPEGRELWIYNAFINKKNFDYIDEMDVIIAKGADPVTYEPYGIIQNGEKSSVDVRSVNLFDKSRTDGTGFFVNNDGKLAQAITNNLTFVFEVKPNTTYSYWHCDVKGGGRCFESSELLSIGDDATWTDGKSIIIQPNIVKTITTKADTKYLYVCVGRIESGMPPVEQQVNDFMLIRGTPTSTQYFPYVTPQTTDCVDLYQVKTYADAYNPISGIATKRCGVVFFNGSEKWSKNGTTAYYTEVLGRVRGIQCPYICSHFPKLQMFMTINVGLLVEYLPATITDVDTLKVWLKEQYEAGTPVTIVYPLETETTQQLDPKTFAQYRNIKQVALVDSEYVECDVDVMSMGENDTREMVTPVVIEPTEPTEEPTE